MHILQQGGKKERRTNYFHATEIERQTVNLMKTSPLCPAEVAFLGVVKLVFKRNSVLVETEVSYKRSKISKNKER